MRLWVEKGTNKHSSSLVELTVQREREHPVNVESEPGIMTMKETKSQSRTLFALEAMGRLH